jgi:hypothetical protein
MERNAQENLVSIGAYDKPEEFAGIKNFKKSFQQGSYYLVLTGEEGKEAEEMVASFRFTKETVSVPLDNDKLLKKLFPSLTFAGGKAQGEFVSDAGSLPYTVSLKSAPEDFFTNKRVRTRLLVAELQGLPHAEGLYHGFLGLFDRKGDLLTPAAVFSNKSFGWDTVELNDGSHFGGDDGKFGFYPCHGLKYILFVSSSCPNSSCCDDRAAVYKVGEAQFVKVQDIPSEGMLEKSNPVYGSKGFAWKMVPAEGKLLIKKIPGSAWENLRCGASTFKELRWNGESCRFE